MENRIVRDLFTGEIVEYPTGIECALIYYNTEFNFGALPFTVPEGWIEERSVDVEVYKMTDIELILDHYLNILKSGYHTYSRFYVLNDNRCDLYIPGFNFLQYYEIVDPNEDRNPRLDFWLLRLKYHKKMIYVMDRFSFEEPSFIGEIVETEPGFENCYNYVDIDNLTIVAQVGGYDTLGFEEWECKNKGCAECLSLDLGTLSYRT